MLPGKIKGGLYVHIPFCDHKCIYCDFYSIITTGDINNFLNSVKKESDYYAQIYSGGREFSSIFFGGGTPSLMKPEYLHQIILSLNKNFTISADAEITIETNPGTVDSHKLAEFREAGINRISIGIQSFDEDDLKFLTRIHNSNTAVETVHNAKSAGFNNISIDLIFNLPGQTKEKWMENLRKAVSLPIDHISAYSLILERGTILNKMVLDGKVKIEDEDFDAELYELTIDFLSGSGFQQYEISNYSKPGFECVHNNSYWSGNDYIGFGPSAHSFAQGKRWWNFSSLKRYISEVDLKSNAVAGFENLSKPQLFSEFIMLSLRSKGIDLKKLERLYGDEWLKNNFEMLSELKKNNFILYDDNFISLTKKGYAVCDEIAARLV
jgi:oxygen-independent coproporphyrinogen III oxidase